MFVFACSISSSVEVCVRWVCVCVRARLRRRRGLAQAAALGAELLHRLAQRLCVCVCVCVRARARALACAYVRVCANEVVCVRVCEKGKRST